MDLAEKALGDLKHAKFIVRVMMIGQQ